MGLSGLKSRCWQAVVLPEDSRRDFIFLPFLKISFYYIWSKLRISYQSLKDATWSNFLNPHSSLSISPPCFLTLPSWLPSGSSRPAQALATAAHPLLHSAWPHHLGLSLLFREALIDLLSLIPLSYSPCLVHQWDPRFHPFKQIVSNPWLLGSPYHDHLLV